MRATYAVNWQEQTEQTRTGKLELHPCSLVFDGMDGVGPSSAEVQYRDISGVGIARRSSERIAGRPTLVLDRHGGPSIRIASVAQPGIVSELAEHLARLHLGEEWAVSRSLVVIPLKPGTHAQVRRIVHSGPPFDPEGAGLERHHVFLTEHEAVFVFESAAPGAIEPLVRDARVWTAASEWAEVAAGPPRVADDVYDWIRLEPAENVIYTSTPGPGNSDGGDLYAP
jgi:hypothetical protein